jgi:hypothetical protein
MDTPCQYDQQEAAANGKTYFDPYKFLLPRMKSKLPRRLFQDTPEIQVQSLTNLHVSQKKSDPLVLQAAEETWTHWKNSEKDYAERDIKHQ